MIDRGGVEPDFTCNDDILRNVEVSNYVFFNLINYVVTYDGTIRNKAGIVFNVILLTFDDKMCTNISQLASN